MEVQCDTFVLSSDALPSLEDWTAATDPTQMEAIYRKAGLTKLAKNVGPLKRATQARHNYAELSIADQTLYAGVLTDTVSVADCVIPPPEAAVTVLLAAQEAKLFDTTIVLTNPSTGESLLLGCVQIADNTSYFKLAHWGVRLTTIEELRKRQQQHFSRTAVQQFQRLRLSFQRSSPTRRRRHGPLHFGAITVLATAVPWGLFAFTGIGWWLFMLMLVPVLVFCGWYTNTKNDSYDDETTTVVVAFLIIANAVLAFVAGGIHMDYWYTQSRTSDVLVCGVAPASAARPLQIHTSAGDKSIESGFYNGTYYSSVDPATVKSLLGNWVRVTEHGSSLAGTTSGPYVTGATTLRSGVCG